MQFASFTSPAFRDVTVRVRAYSGQSCFSDSVYTIRLHALPELRFDPVAPVCGDAPSFRITENVLVNPGSVSGTWTLTGNGITAPDIFDPVAAGRGVHPITFTYTSDKGCEASVSQMVGVYEVPRAIAPASVGLLEGGTVVLNGSGSTGNNLSFLWTPAYKLSDPTAPNPVATPETDFTYKLTVTSADGCVDSTEVNVTLMKTPKIPNVFTPNGDGINDKWDIPYLNTYPGATIEIYNRYGQLLYQSKGYNKAWDGTFKGNPVPAGTYYYIINPKNGRKQMSGFVDVIR
jgi:gliding motility-associated-like protein